MTTPTPAAPRPSPGVVPPARTLLQWLYVGRITVASAVFLAAALSWWRADLTALLVASVSVTLSLVVTAASYWRSHIRPATFGQTFLYTQAVFDIALVTAIVHISGPYSYFAALYILVIALNTVMMPLANGLLVALLAGIVYTADVFFGGTVEQPAAVLLQVAVYWLVATATGYLASRVRVVRAAHENLEAELRRVRLEAADILRHIGAGVLTIGGDGSLVYANPTAEALLGLGGLAGGNVPRGRTALEQLDRVAPELGEAIRRTAREGRRVVRTVAEAAAGGRTFPIGFTTTAVQGEAGTTPSVTAIFQDISDARRLEELRLRTERLEAVAEISASLAHEIKNPLASIRSAVTQLSRLAPPGADERVLAGLIVRESDRLSALLTEFLDFSRVRVTRSAPLDLAAVAEQGIRLARQHPDCADGAQIRLEAPVRPVLVEGDEDLLHRVVFNLVLNAVQASPTSSDVSVRVLTANGGELPAGVVMDAPRLLEVRDAGPGVAPEVLPRLFVPFVTARPGGSGLGLAIVQRAVQAHRGLIFCDSTLGRGTTFSVFLPARFSAEEPA